MKLFDKIKDILFDDEEDDLPIIETDDKDDKKEVIEEQEELEPVLDIEPNFKEPEPIRKEFVDDFETSKKRTPLLDETIEVPERDLYKVNNTFNFPMDVDDNDFMPVDLPKRNPNALEIEQKKIDVEKYIVKKTETKVVREGPFKASPVISPVYGIMDKNYKKEDIIVKQKIEVVTTNHQESDLDKVRKKAFGTLEDEIETTLEKPFTDFYKEVEEVVPTKSVDDLLIDAMDEPEEIKEENISNNKVEESSLNETFKLDEVIKEMKKTAAELESEEDDLFDLIDSMYEDKEE